MPAILQCPSCSDTVLETHLYCPRCGAALAGEGESPTGTAPRPSPRIPASPTPRSGPPKSGTPSPGRPGTSTAGISRAAGGAPAPGERFAAGDLLLDRYRIIGLLGRGGMGEVYRAEDLKLGQPVALKFLPAFVEGEPGKLERFFNEARMAREVSHPAVCRVHDVADVEGRHFLSMEYVDGEDLASLVRRIGRLPGDKAIEIARQICAGLAAAHAKGVLHRDLKPQNVMLDGRGKVRITDFGLAGLAETIQGDDVRSGTPAYMSPEQLAGREVSLRSDIYALGLVLYELFTGKRAYPGRSLAEIKKQHEEPLLPPSDLVSDMAPEAEAAILRCLDPDPTHRPPSATMVSALLSGADPLAAVLAVGETPSPEMVAAAGRTEGIRPTQAWACVGAIVASIVGLFALSRGREFLDRFPYAKPPEVLEDRARDLLAKLGPSVPPVDHATGYASDQDFIRWARGRDDRGTQWERLATGEPAAASFWLRTSPRPLVPALADAVGWADPPLTMSDMAGVRLDLSGRLVSFYRIPPQVDRDGAGPSSPDWSPLFAEARLDPARFKAAPPQWTPPFFCDTRAAWEGTYPQRPEIPLRVEGAAYKGRPVAFFLVAPWTRPERMDPFEAGALETAGDIFVTTLLVALLVAGAFLARLHLKAGRGDRRGAFRLATVVSVLGCVEWVLVAHHVRDREGELDLMARGASEILLAAFILWVFYLALEPYVRRYWPHTIVSWTRLLGGAVRDPLVGRDVLAGATWGAGLAVALAFSSRLPEWLGHGPVAPSFGSLNSLLGPSRVLGALALYPFYGIRIAVAALLILLLLKKVLRRERLAAFVLAVILTMAQVVGQSANSTLPAWILIPLDAVVMGSFTVLLLRFGLLSAAVGVAFVNGILSMPMTADLRSWAAGPTILVGMAATLLVAFGFRASQGAGLRPLPRR